MIRLTDQIFDALIHEEGCPTPIMESHLMGLKIQFWPLFQKEMNSQIDSVKKCGESTGVFGGKSSGLKEPVLQAVMAGYVKLFNSLVALSEESEEDNMVNRQARFIRCGSEHF